MKYVDLYIASQFIRDTLKCEQKRKLESFHCLTFSSLPLPSSLYYLYTLQCSKVMMALKRKNKKKTFVTHSTT